MCLSENWFYPHLLTTIKGNHCPDACYKTLLVMVIGRRWTNKTEDWLIKIYGGKWWWGRLKWVVEMKTIEMVNKWSMMLCSVLRGKKSLCGLSVGTHSPTALSKSTLCLRESSEPNEHTFIITSHRSHQLYFLLVFFFPFFPPKSGMLMAISLFSAFVDIYLV